MSSSIQDYVRESRVQAEALVIVSDFKHRQYAKALKQDHDKLRLDVENYQKLAASKLNGLESVTTQLRADLQALSAAANKNGRLQVGASPTPDFARQLAETGRHVKNISDKLDLHDASIVSLADYRNEIEKRQRSDEHRWSTHELWLQNLPREFRSVGGALEFTENAIVERTQDLRAGLGAITSRLEADARAREQSDQQLQQRIALLERRAVPAGLEARLRQNEEEVRVVASCVSDVQTDLLRGRLPVESVEIFEDDSATQARLDPNSNVVVAPWPHGMGSESRGGVLEQLPPDIYGGLLSLLNSRASDSTRAGSNAGNVIGMVPPGVVPLEGRPHNLASGGVTKPRKESKKPASKASKRPIATGNPPNRYQVSAQPNNGSYRSATSHRQGSHSSGYFVDATLPSQSSSGRQSHRKPVATRERPGSQRPISVLSLSSANLHALESTHDAGISTSHTSRGARQDQRYITQCVNQYRPSRLTPCLGSGGDKQNLGASGSSPMHQMLPPSRPVGSQRSEMPPPERLPRRRGRTQDFAQ